MKNFRVLNKQIERPAAIFDVGQILELEFGCQEGFNLVKIGNLKLSVHSDDMHKKSDFYIIGEIRGNRLYVFFCPHDDSPMSDYTVIDYAAFSLSDSLLVLTEAVQNYFDYKMSQFGF